MTKLDRKEKDKSNQKKHNIIGRVRIKIFNWYLLKPHKSNGYFVRERGNSFMKEYFGSALETNPKDAMHTRRMGFEDGYLACLKDLGITLTYDKKDKQ